MKWFWWQKMWDSPEVSDNHRRKLSRMKHSKRLIHFFAESIRRNHVPLASCIVKHHPQLLEDKWFRYAITDLIYEQHGVMLCRVLPLDTLEIGKRALNDACRHSRFEDLQLLWRMPIPIDDEIKGICSRFLFSSQWEEEELPQWKNLYALFLSFLEQQHEVNGFDCLLIEEANSFEEIREMYHVLPSRGEMPYPHDLILKEDLSPLAVRTKIRVLKQQGYEFPSFYLTLFLPEKIHQLKWLFYELPELWEEPELVKQLIPSFEDQVDAYVTAYQQADFHLQPSNALNTLLSQWHEIPWTIAFDLFRWRFILRHGLNVWNGELEKHGHYLMDFLEEFPIRPSKPHQYVKTSKLFFDHFEQNEDELSPALAKRYRNYVYTHDIFK